MNPELETLDTLSARFETLVDSLPRSGSGRRALALAPEDPLPGEGEQILEVYEALYAQAPGEGAVRGALAQHLFRLGSLYEQAVEPTLLGGGTGEAARMAGYAQRACRCLLRSFELLPGPYAALALADLFRGVGFYGTALVWYGQAEQARGDGQTREEAGRQRQALQAQRRTTDPPLPAGSLFPTPDTPGLAAAGPAGSTGSAARAGHTADGTGRYAAYGAAALLVLLACVGGAVWVRSHATAGSSSGPAATTASGPVPTPGTATARSAEAGHAAGSRASPTAMADRSAWTLRASSTRKPVADRADAHTITYAPGNAVDADATTAWSPGKNMANDGIGEWLEVDFPGPRRLARIGMTAGYPKQHAFYGDVFWLNNRVKEALLTFSDGSTVSWTLKDRKPMQFLDLPAPVSTSSVRIAIQSVYPSASHKGGRTRWHDTSVAEVAFWQAP